MRDLDEQDLLLYKKMYLRLFNGVTDALRSLDRGDTAQAKSLLVSAQQACEAFYISAGQDYIPPEQKT